MYKILKYSLFDLLRSRWTFIYLGFYLLLAFGLLWLSGDHGKVIISLMNVELLLAPLIATMFSVIYFYNSREFVELLLAQPIPRTHIFLGQYLGVSISLALSYLLGVGVPFLLFGIVGSPHAANFLVVLLSGAVLSFIFSALAFWIALKQENRLKGFGFALLSWLFFAVIYDGILLLLMTAFRDYPLDGLALGASLLNPIDLSRVMILLQLDISALMGYTGALFKQFMGAGPGMLMVLGSLLLWGVVPVWAINRVARKRDF